MEWISKISEGFIRFTLKDKFDIDIQSFSNKRITFEEIGMDGLDSMFRSIIRNEKINKILEDE